MANIARRTTGQGQVRYDVRWRLPDGSVRTKTFRRRSDADAYRRKVESDELVGVITDHRRGKLVLRDLADQWLESTPTKRSRSLERDRSNLACHVFPDLGARRVQSITRADVQRLVDGLTGTHAPSTVQRVFSTLRALLSYAERCELIPRNPTRGVRLPRAGVTHRPVLGADDLERLAAAIGEADAPLMWLGVILGLRLSPASWCS